MIIRAHVVVTMDRPPLENGAVAISGNRIVDVGPFDEIKARNSGEVVDLGEQALLPGLINAHCHLDYTCLRGKIPRQKSFADWIRAINSEKAKLSAGDYLASIREGFAEAKKFGTTTVANLTAFPQLVAKIRPPIRTWWFGELIDVRSPEHANAIVDLAVESLKSTKNWGLAPHALFTASADLYRRCEEIARRKNVLLTTHLAESREEMSMFRDGSGPLFEFMKEVGRPVGDCGHATPLELFVGALGSPRPIRPVADGGALPRWIVAHLNELTGSDFDLLERSTTRFHIVYSPRSHAYFAHSPFPFERLHALGFNICLGTDSLASNDDLSLFAEMRAFQKMFSNVPAEEIFEMVTVNPVRALNQSRHGGTLGRIRPGFHVDLVAIPRSGSRDVFEEIVAFDGSVAWVMIDGRAVEAGEE